MTVINESTSQNAAVKRIEFVGPSVGADLAQTGALALIAALVCILIYVASASNRIWPPGWLSPWRTTW